MIVLALVISVLFSTCTGASVLEFNPDRTIKLDTQIDYNLSNQAERILVLTAHSKESIYIYINTQGGRMNVASHILSAMATAQKEGVKIICGVEQQAMSAAFFILNECDERYALPHALLMFHSPYMRYNGRIGLNEARGFYKLYSAWVERILEKIRVKTNIDMATLRQMLTKEEQVPVEKYQELSPAYITIVNKFTGI